MGSGHCFKTIIIRKKFKKDRSKRGKGLTNGETNGTRDLDKNSVIKDSSRAVLSEDMAARRIQAFFKGYLARKSFRSLKGIARYHSAIKPLAAENQQISALKRIHFWGKIQAEVNARRMYMVTQGRTNQKKLENKQKLEAKIHEVEVEWSNGSETMEEILQRIQQREEAAAKRERAMAYAFSHQWKANTIHHFGRAYYDLGKDSWGWSWKERWVAVRPWEVRVQSKPINSKKTQHKQADKAGKTTGATAIKQNFKIKQPVSPLLNGRHTTEPRKPVG